MRGGASSRANADTDESSPERRSPTVKVTYLGRQKKKRQLSDTFLMVPPSDADALSQSPVSNDPNGDTSLGAGGGGVGQERGDPDSKVEQKGPPKIDFKLPGPSPKRDTGNGDHPKTPGTKVSERKLHSRSASMASLTRAGSRGTIASPSSAQKPGSMRSSRSMNPPILTPKRSSTRIYAEAYEEEEEEEDEDDDDDDDEDDGASVVDSISSSKVIRRTEAERKQYFHNEPDAGELEDHRVHCKRCKKWVNLGKNRKYMVRPWEAHRGKCDQLPRQESSDAVMSPDANTAGDGDESDDAASPTEVSKRKRRKKSMSAVANENTRKAFLENDEYVEDFEASEAKCRKCQKWIVLSKSTTYSLHNWYRHRSSCIDGLNTKIVKTPSSRVATAERKLKIVNDARAKSFGPKHVECKKCGVNIILQGAGDYNLAAWEIHQAQCSPNNQAIPAPGVLGSVGGASRGNSMNLPGGATRAPPSIASTDGGTIIASEISSPSGPGLKRPRVEGDSELPRNDPDARPQIRPRTETYEPSKKEAPGPFGWFLLPFKAFVRGFRESLKAGDPSPSA